MGQCYACMRVCRVGLAAIACVPCRYFMYAFTCLVERAWRFGLPLVLVDIPGRPSYLCCSNSHAADECITLSRTCVCRGFPDCGTSGIHCSSGRDSVRPGNRTAFGSFTTTDSTKHLCCGARSMHSHIRCDTLHMCILCLCSTCFLNVCQAATLRFSNVLPLYPNIVNSVNIVNWVFVIKLTLTLRAKQDSRFAATLLLNDAHMYHYDAHI